MNQDARNRIVALLARAIQLQAEGMGDSPEYVAVMRSIVAMAREHKTLS